MGVSASRSAEVFTRFLRLGCTSFGGPVAHLGYFRREFVRAGWVDDAAFAEIVALCSILPGPTSSQVGIVLGARRAGPAGGLLALIAFATPSALALGAFGLFLRAASGADPAAFARGPRFAGALEGLAAAAAAVVAIAVVQLARNVVRTRFEVAPALVAFGLALILDRFAPAFAWVALVAGGALGAAFGRAPATLPARAPALAVSRGTAMIAGGVFVALLAGLPLVAPPGTYLDTFATFYRAGSLVFGGGHVVLPFLQSYIGSGVSERTFFAGYGAAQAMPGPLFTFAAFLGAAMRPLGGVIGALVALAGIFLPSFLLLAAVMPLWSALRQLPRAAETLAGLNAAVAGLLAAVFVDPIATTLARDPVGIALALFALLTLATLRFPAWLTVAACALLGALIRSYALPSSL